MVIFKILLKIVGIGLAVVVALMAGVFGYEYFEDKRRDNEELTYFTSKKWVWYDKYGRVQVNQDIFTKKSILRKVNLDKNYVIYIFKNQDYSISAMAVFPTKCEPNTEIVTSKAYSDGTLKKLQCMEDGDALVYSVSWSAKDTDFKWTEDLDGFKIDENFRYWNFDKLDQEITLQKAK
ncbi:hypothetical protein GJQ54_11945 [Oceanospirillaceae bacterium ASx5O]|jgi:hypothetical protein|nr:hypothetical protein GJQ54_11945 [Oceanospirillaceae bacterium ASx5O]